MAESRWLIRICCGVLTLMQMGIIAITSGRMIELISNYEGVLIPPWLHMSSIVLGY